MLLIFSTLFVYNTDRILSSVFMKEYKRRAIICIERNTRNLSLNAKIG